MVNCTGKNCPFKGTTKEEAAVCDNSSYCICVSPPKKAVYKTNAAKIRMMTDEELADFINDAEYGLIERPGMCDVCKEHRLNNCKNCWLGWLKQEVEQ